LAESRITASGGAEQEAEHHHHAGQPQREQQPVEHGGGGEVPADHVPLEGVVADDGVDHHREDQQRRGSRRPAADMPARHDPWQVVVGDWAARGVAGGFQASCGCDGFSDAGGIGDVGWRDHQEALQGREARASVTTRRHR